MPASGAARPVQELKELAKRLGETYMAMDLGALMSQKREAVDHPSLDSRPLTARYSDMGASTSRSLLNFSAGGAPVGSIAQLATYRSGESGASECVLHGALTALRRSAGYQVTCGVLQVLAALTRNGGNTALLRSPLNLLFAEMWSCFCDPLLREDTTIRALLLDVLANFSCAVEHDHVARGWCGGEETAAALSIRRRRDTVLCRIGSMMRDAVAELHAQRDRWEHACVLLRMAREYVRHCKTRVMALQVADALMEQLLAFKQVRLPHEARPRSPGPLLRPLPPAPCRSSAACALRACVVAAAAGADFLHCRAGSGDRASEDRRRALLPRAPGRDSRPKQARAVRHLPLADTNRGERARALEARLRLCAVSALIVGCGGPRCRGRCYSG